ncbi:MAG: transporter related [Actinomycetia bacterium]|nr:transporter related [Actinomycetes bacterium]
MALAAELPVLPDTDVPLLELRGIRAGYGGVEALHGIDLVVPGGSIVALLGPNGAGKTTTLAVVNGLLTPTAGSVLLEGHDVSGASTVALARAGVCLIPEGRGIFPNLTVRENLLMDTYAAGKPVAEIEEAAYGRFPRLGERRSQVAGTLSGGEQQMLALSRALSSDPALILLDELSMGLAPLIVDELFTVVAELAATGVTILVVEQFASVVLGVADHVAVMAQGLIRLQGRPDEVRDELHAAYLGGGER